MNGMADYDTAFDRMCAVSVARTHPKENGIENGSAGKINIFVCEMMVLLRLEENVVQRRGVYAVLQYFIRGLRGRNTSLITYFHL